jgi:beta-N-acetylhexosaminidase
MSAQVGAIEQVVQAVKSGELSQELIAASIARVKALKASYLPSSPRLGNVDIKAQESLASEIYAKSTTVVRSELGAFPSKLPSAP